MLGEQIADWQGRVSGRRVLSTDGPKIEVSNRLDGKTVGVDTTAMATYWAVPKAGGTLYGEGQGVVMTKDGEMATFEGSGTGKLKPGGGVSWRGVCYFHTASQKLARVNGVAGVFEYEVDANDNASAKFWEWK